MSTFSGADQLSSGGMFRGCSVLVGIVEMAASRCPPALFYSNSGMSLPQYVLMKPISISILC